MVKTGIKLLIFCVEVIKTTVNKGETWSRGTNSLLPFGVNVNLNLSILTVLTFVQPISNSVWMDA